MCRLLMAKKLSPPPNTTPSQTAEQGLPHAGVRHRHRGERPPRHEEHSRNHGPRANRNLAEGPLLATDLWVRVLLDLGFSGIDVLVQDRPWLR